MWKNFDEFMNKLWGYFERMLRQLFRKFLVNIKQVIGIFLAKS